MIRASATPLHRRPIFPTCAHDFGGTVKSRSAAPFDACPRHELELSRNTVVEAFEQLLAEGYIAGRSGSGTFVNQLLTAAVRAPAFPANGHMSRTECQSGRATCRYFSRSLAVIGQAARVPTGCACTRLVSTRSVAARAAASSRRWHRTRSDTAIRRGIARSSGIGSLLGRSHGVRCNPEQVIVVSGARRAMDLTARLLLDPGDTVWMEEPGYRGAPRRVVGGGRAINSSTHLTRKGCP